MVLIEKAREFAININKAVSEQLAKAAKKSKKKGDTESTEDVEGGKTKKRKKKDNTDGIEEVKDEEDNVEEGKDADSSTEQQYLICKYKKYIITTVNINSIKAMELSIMLINKEVDSNLMPSSAANNDKIKNILVGCYVGAKRAGDWLQCNQAKKYNILISTDDFWCQIYALLTQTPIIINNYLYNYDTENPTQLKEDNWFKYSGSKKGDGAVLSFNSLYSNIHLDAFRHITSSEHNDSYKSGSASSPPLLARSGSVRPLSHPVLELTKENFFKVIKKYLKYKNKYLKTKTGKTIDNHEMDAITNHLFENVNESNIKQHIEQIKNKYLKYKNKYLKINILE